MIAQKKHYSDSAPCLIFALCFLLVFFSGCQSGFQKMEGGQHAVVFSALPTFLGGGVKNKALEPGEMEFIFPWETIYRFDTSIQSIGWGSVGRGDNLKVDDYVETRSRDGNEVGLAVTIQYQIEPTKLPYIVEYVGSSDEKIRELVSAVARAEIRAHLNTLSTRDFFSPNKRQAAISDLQHGLSLRLNKEGILIRDVIYNDHRFERRLPDGTVDQSYQEQIDRTQAINQETEQEKKKIATVVENKKREFNEEQARVNRQLEEIAGYKTQAQLRGDSYLAAKLNDAEGIRAKGNAEVEGLRKQVAALSGPGGRALLKLAIAKALQAKSPNFVVLQSSQDRGGIGLNKVDSNELLRQFAVGVAAQESQSSPKTQLTDQAPPADKGKSPDSLQQKGGL